MSPEVFRPSATMRPAVDPDAFLAEMCGIAEQAFTAGGYPNAARAVSRRLPNCPDVCAYADWLIECAGIILE